MARSFRLGRFRLKWWHVVLPVAIVIVILAVRPLLELLKGIFGAVNVAGSKLIQGVGLDPALNAKVATIETVDQLWSGKRFLQWCADNNKAPMSMLNIEVAEQRISEVKLCQSFMGGVDMPAYISTFNNFQSQVDFSSFCWYWQQKERTQLASWMLSGWLFGLVSSMGKSDLEKLDVIIGELPEFN